MENLDKEGLQAVGLLLVERLRARVEALDGAAVAASELRQLTAAYKDLKALETERSEGKILVEGMPEEFKQ